MTIRLATLLLFVLLGCRDEHINPSIIALSPDGRLSMQLNLDEGVPHYLLLMNGDTLIKPSSLGYAFRGMPDMAGPFTLVSHMKEYLDEDWTPVWGQENHITSRSYYTKIELQEAQYPQRLLNLHFRLFNDGLGFRYEIPKQLGIDSVFIQSEKTEFNLAEDAQVWWIPADYDSYEKIYTKSPLSELKDSVHTPLTMKTMSGYYLSIHEADLSNYASMTLMSDPIQPFKLTSDLVPWPDGDKVKTVLPMISPWRTITVGHNAIDLLNSRLILNLNSPNRLDDISWIKPMKYIGIWWGMHVGKESWGQGDIHGATTANTIQHIDFAAENNIQGVLVEGWNQGWEQWGEDDAFKFTSPYSDYNIEQLTHYARDKGVVLLGHHETGGDAASYEKQLEEAFAYYHELGIPAVKTGYAGVIRPHGQHHHGQWMVEHYRRVLEMAAKYKVTLDVHEPIKPTGIERTWPHMMTREGGRGMEWNAWSEGNPPNHTTILPFTRLLAGPMDYTPGIFDLHFDQYKPDNRVHTTLAKQLALLVIMYSPLQMAADLIENYENQLAFQFIRDLQVDWDETLYLEGEIGEKIVIARRHGEEWFLGAITNEVERDIIIPLSQIIEQDMIVEMYADGAGADWEQNPYPIHISSYMATVEDSLSVWIAPGGGMAARFRPIQPEEQLPGPISDLTKKQLIAD